MEETTLTNPLLLAGASLCPLLLLTLLVGFLWAVVIAIRESVARLKRLHSIPCPCCGYFTGCHYLKCTVHPDRACTEDAIDCHDFEPAWYGKSCCSGPCNPSSPVNK